MSALGLERMSALGLKKDGLRRERSKVEKKLKPFLPFCPKQYADTPATGNADAYTQALACTVFQMERCTY
eukprot:3292186-Pleurochrysis_carterae.AAC.1